MQYVAIAIVLGLLGGGAYWLFIRGARAATHAIVDSRPAETEATANAQLEARKNASDVLRASDDDIRRRVDELRARGRRGK